MKLYSFLIPILVLITVVSLSFSGLITGGYLDKSSGVVAGENTDAPTSATMTYEKDGKTYVVTKVIKDGKVYITTKIYDGSGALIDTKEVVKDAPVRAEKTEPVTTEKPVTKTEPVSQPKIDPMKDQGSEIAPVKPVISTPVNYNDSTGNLEIVTPQGNVELQIQPEDVLKEVQNQGNEVDGLKLEERPNGNMQYVVTGQTTKRFLGLFKINIPDNKTYDAGTGALVKQPFSLKYTILNALSF